MKQTAVSADKSQGGLSREEKWDALTPEERSFLQAGVWSSVDEAYQYAMANRKNPVRAGKLSAEDARRLERLAPLIQSGKMLEESVYDLTPVEFETIASKMPLLMHLNMTVDEWTAFSLSLEDWSIQPVIQDCMILIVLKKLGVAKALELSPSESWRVKWVTLLLISDKINIQDAQKLFTEGPAKQAIGRLTLSDLALVSQHVEDLFGLNTALELGLIKSKDSDEVLATPMPRSRHSRIPSHHSAFFKPVINKATELLPLIRAGKLTLAQAQELNAEKFATIKRIMPIILHLNTTVNECFVKLTEIDSLRSSGNKMWNGVVPLLVLNKLTVPEARSLSPEDYLLARKIFILLLVNAVSIDELKSNISGSAVIIDAFAQLTSADLDFLRKQLYKESGCFNFIVPKEVVVAYVFERSEHELNGLFKKLSNNDPVLVATLLKLSEAKSPPLGMHRSPSAPALLVHPPAVSNTKETDANLREDLASAVAAPGLGTKSHGEA